MAIGSRAEMRNGSAGEVNLRGPGFDLLGNVTPKTRAPNRMSRPMPNDVLNYPSPMPKVRRPFNGRLPHMLAWVMVIAFAAHGFWFPLLRPIEFWDVIFPKLLALTAIPCVVAIIIHACTGQIHVKLPRFARISRALVSLLLVS